MSPRRCTTLRRSVKTPLALYSTRVLDISTEDSIGGMRLFLKIHFFWKPFATLISIASIPAISIGLNIDVFFIQPTYKLKQINHNLNKAQYTIR